MVLSLSFHASYRCRHSGACCTAGWPIPIEADRLAGLRAALAGGRLRPAIDVDGPPWIAAPDAPAGTPARLAASGPTCVFFDRAGGHRCAVHRALGHEALPLACRQFPRVVVRDPRGVSVTLSHYCPTAAALLEDDRPVRIVSDPQAFPSGGEYVGLDAETALPPLLRPDVLMDWEAWWEWEAQSVRLLAAAASPEDALRRLAAAVEDVRAWRPGSAPLLDRVRRAFAEAVAAPEASNPLPAAWIALRTRLAVEAVPADLRDGGAPTTPSGGSRLPARVTARYLAAHAFANWTAHLGSGLRSWLRSVETAFALVAAGWDVRRADLLLRHYADTTAVASACARAESG
jgi:Fe-S-cluster containining protein